MATPEAEKRAKANYRERHREKIAAANRIYSHIPSVRARSYELAKRRRTFWTPEEKERVNKKQREIRRATRKDPKLWPLEILRGIKSRCRKQSIPCDIEYSDIAVPDVCPVFNVPFVFGAQNHPHSPSVDRLRCALGYVKGNVRVISRRANIMKSDAETSADVRAVAAYMEREGL